MKVFAKSRLREVLAVLATDATVWVPAAAGGRTAFVPWEPGVEPLLAANADRGLKAALFPAMEKVYRYELNHGAATVTTFAPAGGTVLFGVRNCDAAAIGLLDKILLGGGCADACYGARRQDSVVFALGCAAPGDGCFCALLGLEATNSAAADVQMHDTGAGYSLTARSDAGRAAEARLAAAGLLGEAAVTVPSVTDGVQPMDFAALSAKLKGMFDARLWEEIAAVCLGCGACTYVCPTCHCFDMTDERKDARCGYKLRAWDSCQWGEYTRMAGGHNPRPGKKERVRQRFMHKLCYGPERHGAVLCTGCGRCQAVCPVNLGMAGVLARVKEESLDG